MHKCITTLHRWVIKNNYFIKCTKSLICPLTAQLYNSQRPPNWTRINVPLDVHTSFWQGTQQLKHAARTDGKHHCVVCTYIRRKTRRCGWCWHTRGFHAAWRNSRDTLSCTQAAGISSPATASRGPRSRQGTSNYFPAESRHIRTISTGRNTDRVYHLTTQTTVWWRWQGHITI